MDIRRVGLMPPSSERDQNDFDCLNEKIDKLKNLKQAMKDKYSEDLHENSLPRMSLTSRIKEGGLNSNSCFREIMRRSFDNQTFHANIVKLPLTDKTLEMINKIHFINPSFAGYFFEHLIFTFIHEMKSCSWGHDIHNHVVKFNKPKLIAIKTNTFSICLTKHTNVFTGEDKIPITKKPYSISDRKTNGFLHKNQRFIILETGPDWFLIDTQLVLESGPGWSFTELVSGFILKNKTEFIDEKPNIWMEIMEDLQFFGGKTELIEDFKNKLIDIIGDEMEWAEEIYEVCSWLVKDKSKISLNKGLMGTIPAQCDLIADDLLVDIKCTRERNENYCVLQLLGYTGLLYHGPLGINIEKIANLNLLRGEYIEYDISEITDKQLEQFLNILDP